MKLLFFIDNLGSGGAQRQMVNLARGLKVRGHNVEIFIYYPHNHYLPLLDEVGIPVHGHLKSSRFSFSPLFALRRLISQNHFDLVLSFLDTPNFYAEIARIGLGKSKLVVSERFMYQPGPLPIQLRLLQECHRLADSITVNSHHQRQRMVQQFPWMTQKIQTIYNGFDLDTFFPKDSVVRDDDTVNLLAISSVSFKKNSLNLAHAMDICRVNYQLNVHVDWVGTQQVSGEGGRATQQTSEYLLETGLASKWNWLGESTNIPELLSNHDALIHPSYFEGLPNVVCEALACGRPVLASNVCDHPKLVQEGTTGYLFDPNSAADIARSIYTFSQLELSARKLMGSSARSFAEKHLSLKRFVDEYESLFISLID